MAQDLHHILSGKGIRVAFVKKPVLIIADPLLTPADKCIFDAVAYFDYRAEGKGCSESTTIIGALANLSKRQAIASIEKLCDRGYIRRERNPNPRRPDLLVLLCGALAIPAQATVDVASEIKVRKQCGRCRRPVRSIGKQGWCRACVTEANLEIRIREAKLELGDGASDEQIATYLHLRKITGPVRKVLRKMERAA